MSTVTFTVTTSFGCACGGCTCQTCGTGRKYPVTLRKTDMISAIWDEMIKQNAGIKEKRIKPFLFMGNQQLELDKRIINYEFDEDSKVIAVMPTSTCCTTAFRKEPKKRGQDFSDEEILETPMDVDELQRRQNKSMDSSTA
eukprot:Blabericola_migrator_1__7618@NODE_3894_length_1443_cov_236_776890_g2406_i0_p2_GENE_NODE_3894_length_1443_cov_236_776890_g2406_i0NODE_3894_length_1443_cov_236_776890_g2406_i0_p2_ORF_typecomplete_len141_score22_26ubiquitin/PF00240_23/0_033p6/PF17548_2/0_12_NODE_3894_length_1443_cov_236_776890_g2406_i044466